MERFLCFLFCLSVVMGRNNNYTFTYSMAMKCKEYVSRHGYNYETFYSIDEDTFQHATVKKDNTEISYFEMHIAIQAASNGHILLSPVPFPSAMDPVYEIVVGGGGNKFTELRLNLKRNARSSSKTPNILSAVDFTAFFIKVSDDGLVEFGREGDILPLLSYYDARSLPIKYFSFASWTGVEAKFLYDCPAPGDNDAITPDSQAVEPKLSNSDELKRSLLLSRLPSIPPAPIVFVRLGIKVTHVKYDALDSKLTTRMAVVMSWTDDSMAWNPIKFNGTTSLKFRQGQIWRPKFFVFNSDSIEVFDTKNADLITVIYSGEATFHFQTEVTTWCADSFTGMNKWPHDEYSCSIVIEPWEVHEMIEIEVLRQNDTKLAVFADIDEIIPSEWDVDFKVAMVVSPQLWNIVYLTDDNETHQSDRYVITADLRRRAASYNIAFYTPLLVLIVFVLMSFWDNHIEESKLHFYGGCTIIIGIALSTINFMVPTHNVPSILVFYNSVLGCVVSALMMNVFLLSSGIEEICNTHCVKSVLTCWLFRTVFFLPPIKMSLNGGYLRQEDDETASCSNSNMEEMENEEDKVYGDKHELSEVLNKIMFVIYTFLFACLLVAHY